MMWQPSFSSCLEFVSRNRYSEHQTIRKTRFWFQFFNFHQRSPVMDCQYVQGPMSAGIASSPTRPCKRMNGWMDSHHKCLCQSHSSNHFSAVFAGAVLLTETSFIWTNCLADPRNIIALVLNRLWWIQSEACRYTQCECSNKRHHRDTSGFHTEVQACIITSVPAQLPWWILSFPQISARCWIFIQLRLKGLQN